MIASHGLPPVTAGIGVWLDGVGQAGMYGTAERINLIGLHLIDLRGSFGPPEFSRFCRAHGRDRRTNRPTDHATPSVAIGL